MAKTNITKLINRGDDTKLDKLYKLKLVIQNLEFKQKTDSEALHNLKKSTRIRAFEILKLRNELFNEI